MAGTDAATDGSTAWSADELADGYPLRGTVVLTLLYLLVIVAGWGYVYYVMLQQA